MEAIREGWKKNSTGIGPFRRDFVGWLLCTMVEPPSCVKVKTPAKFDPQEVDSADKVMMDWDRLQNELYLRITEADGLALDRVKVLSPTPKTPDGEVVNAQGIWDSIEPSTMEDLKKTIEKKDSQAFPGAYKAMLEACYTCHKSAGRPYLRPMVLTVAPQTIINYDPDANWPH